MNAETKFRNAVAPFILASVIGLGAMTTWTFCVFWGQLFYSAFFSVDRSSTELVLTVDGEALEATYEPSQVPVTVVQRLPNGNLRSQLGYRRPTYRTLDGKPVEHPALLANWTMRDNLMPAAEERSREGTVGGLIFGYFGEQPPTFWYLIYDGHAHAYFAGFDPLSKLPTGYLGTRGFSTDVPPLANQFAIPERLWGRGSREPSPGDSNGEPSGRFDENEYVYSAGKVYLVNFNKRTVTPLELAGEVLSLGRMSVPRAVDDGAGVDNTSKTLFRLNDAIRDVEGRSFPIPDAIRDQNISVVGTLSDEVILAARNSLVSETELYWIDGQEKVTRHETFPRPPRFDSGGMEWISVLIVPMPVLLAIMLFVAAPLSLLSQNEAVDFPTALAQTLPDVWLPFLIVCLVSIVAAAAVYRRHRRFSEQGAVGWAVFVLLLGLPGWIGYRLHRGWPHRAACANCGAVVPRDRAACLACDADFPPPVHKGIEVFA
jgi:hypothetical protein